MADALRRHELFEADPAAWDAAMARRPDLAGHPEVSGWVRAGRPLILRRFDGAEDRTLVPLGLPLPPSLGKRRIGLALSPDAVRARPPVTLAEARPTAPEPWRPTLDALLALGRDHGLVPRVFGGLLWQHLTGLAYLTETSDLDLLWPVGARVSRTLLLDLAGIEARAPMRLDGEVIFADGTGVNWREFLGAGLFPPPSAGPCIHTSRDAGGGGGGPLSRAGQGEGCDLSGETWVPHPNPLPHGRGARPAPRPTFPVSLRRSVNPVASAGEGVPRVSEGRERGATVPDAALPSPDPLRGPPSPAEGGGRGAAHPARTVLAKTRDRVFLHPAASLLDEDPVKPPRPRSR